MKLPLDHLVPTDGLFSDMVREGYVSVQSHPDDPCLVIYNYTEKAQYEKVWNEVTLNCRGLIVCVEGGDVLAATTVVARPFRKFFNLSEQPDIFGAEDYVVALDKMDGSLGILYTAPDGLPAIATRGSFASPQAQHATKVYRERYHGKWNPSMDSETYLFEIVFPANRIVLDYGQQDDLVLLGSREILSGDIYDPWMAVDFDGWTGPVAETLYEGPLSGALALEDRPNAEGIVIRSATAQAKVKQEDYVALHKIVFGLNERAVWEHLSSGRDSDDMLDGLPDEFHDWVRGVATSLLLAYARINHQCAENLMQCQAAVRLQPSMGLPHVDPEKDPRAYRKEIADYVRKCEHPGIVFSMLDGRDVSKAIWKLVYPPHRTFANQPEEAPA